MDSDPSSGLPPLPGWLAVGVGGPPAVVVAVGCAEAGVDVFCEVGCVVGGGLEVLGAPAVLLGVLPLPAPPGAAELSEGLELLVGLDGVDEAGELGVGPGWDVGCGVAEADAVGVLPPSLAVPLATGTGVAEGGAVLDEVGPVVVEGGRCGG